MSFKRPYKTSKSGRKMMGQGRREWKKIIKAKPKNKSPGTHRIVPEKELCPIHGVMMTRKISKKGYPYLSHILPDGSHCFGLGYWKKKKKNLPKFVQPLIGGPPLSPLERLEAKAEFLNARAKPIETIQIADEPLRHRKKKRTNFGLYS